MSNPPLVVTVIGHWSHGKTSTAAALASSLGAALGPQELSSPNHHVIRKCARRYGRAPDFPTVLPGMAVVDTPAHRVQLEDAPGLRDYIKNTARALSIADAVLLVVDAREGAAAQTREHLIVARALGVEQAVLFLNGCEALDDLELLDVAELEARDALERAGFYGDDAAVVRGSAKGALEQRVHWRAAMQRLAAALDDLRPRRVEAAEPYFDLVHWHRRREGIVIQGRAWGELFKLNELIHLSGFTAPDRVRLLELQISRETVDVVHDGDLFGARIDPSASSPVRVRFARGRRGAHAPATLTQKLALQLTLVEDARHTNIYSGHIAQFIFGAAAVSGRIVLDGRAALGPGETATVSVELNSEIPIPSRFVMRDGTCREVTDTASGRTVPTWGGTAGFGVVLNA